MSGEVELGLCDMCGAEDRELTRKYYHYDIRCDCHRVQHFEIVRFCHECEPQPPKETSVVLDPIDEDTAAILHPDFADREDRLRFLPVKWPVDCGYALTMYDESSRHMPMRAGVPSLIWFNKLMRHVGWKYAESDSVSTVGPSAWWGNPPGWTACNAPAPYQLNDEIRPIYATHAVYCEVEV